MVLCDGLVVVLMFIEVGPMSEYKGFLKSLSSPLLLVAVGEPMLMFSS